jgi:dihydroneopterin aldolase
VTEAIHVRGLRVWAHVGVYEQERCHGQWFELAFSLGADLAATARSDDLSQGYDYGRGIAVLQAQARTIRCQTLEHYSERILDALEASYGPIPLAVEVSKCQVPVPGFDGSVAVSRKRRWG